MKLNTHFILLLFAFLIIFQFAFDLSAQSSTDFLISSKNSQVTLLYDGDEAKTVEIAVNALAHDIELITGRRPDIANSAEGISGNVIVIGTYDHSELIKGVSLPEDQVPQCRETFSHTFLKDLSGDISSVMIICGSDKRGAAYGVFELSRQLGVSPWYWWADVVPEQREILSINSGDFKSNPPSVKFRGIFLNDECWGLNPWASYTYEPEEGNIGPRTYARIFELLLRLRANFIWPAMHPCTNAFYKNPENPKVADDYGIVVGTSHAEPMLRNNVDEWDHHTMGNFNFFNNRESVLDYWDERVGESSGYESVYTMGMRGIHDSGMVGAETIEQKVEALDEIIASQRTLLGKHLDQPVDEVPQAFTAYKEVLDIYDAGLDLPEDITLVWPDDNYGYIKRFSDELEMKREGGSGIYYHLSYWGRPHDYLWLSSTHPSLIREEMIKAAHFRSREIWVANVGDIKPAEHNMSLFLDMAYDAKKFEKNLSEKQHLTEWMSSIFGEETGVEASSILWNYYQLNFERRPEFMGWSQTEPTRKTHFSGFSLFENGDEAQKRIDAFNELFQRVKWLREQVPERLDDAFYQLVWYPVVCAGYMNKKYLYNQKAYAYANQGRTSANDYARMALAAYDSIVSETQYYNNRLSDGKWRHMMDLAPRSLPVFDPPVVVEWDMPENNSWAIATEGDEEIRRSKDVYGPLSLPAFNNLISQKYFIDVFLRGQQGLQWEAAPSEEWITVNKTSGILSGDFGDKQERIWVTVDWSEFPKTERARGKVTFKGDNGKEIVVNVYARKWETERIGEDNLFVENNGYISVFAENFSRLLNKANLQWEVFEGLGYTGNSVWVNPLNTGVEPGDNENTSTLEYDFLTDRTGQAEIHIYCIPVHPLTAGKDVRISVVVNDEEPVVVSHQTFGRSEQWKQNVLSNNAKMTVKFPVEAGRRNVLRIKSVDPGVIIDRIEIDTGGLPEHYLELPESRAY